jgi:hypothetical protein
LGEGQAHCSGSKETNNVGLSPAKDRGGAAGEVGQGEAREESGVKDLYI